MMLDQVSEATATITDLASAWGAEYSAAICENCDWGYLVRPESRSTLCPHCFKVSLAAHTGPASELPYSRPPELLLPFSVSDEQVARSIRNFAGHIWFAPPDLNSNALKLRLQPVFLPMWLVDSEVQAIWQAEAGFNYQAISHRDSFDQTGQGWVSEQITETRIRWEPRLGRLRRSYENIVAPALEEHFDLQRQVGTFDLKAAQPYQATATGGALIRLPNRLPADAWPEARPAVESRAAEECRQACGADHLRDFRWKAEYHHLNWTLLLLPVYATYYLDDEQTPQAVLIHGQSGQISGPRRASMKRAKRVALYLVAAAAVVFTLSLIAALVSSIVPPLFVAAAVGLAMAIVLGLLGLVPIGVAWHFNRGGKRK